jgi:hypothetical protein
MKTALKTAVAGVVPILSGAFMMDAAPRYFHTSIALMSIGGLVVVIGLIVAASEWPVKPS